MSVPSLVPGKSFPAAGMLALVCFAAWTLAAGEASAWRIHKIPLTASGGQCVTQSGGIGSCSLDGRYLMLASRQPDLTSPPGPAGTFYLYVRDLLLGGAVRATVAADGSAPSGSSEGGSGRSLSADGRYLVFSSAAANLVANDTNGAWDVFLRDTATGVTTRVSVGAGGQQANGGSAAGCVSSDGRYVAFASDATNLVPDDTNGALDVFVRDRLTGTTSRASVGSDGHQASGGTPAISGDGRYVVFVGGDDVDPAAPQGGLFVRDTVSGQTTCLSVLPTGLPLQVNYADAWQPAISPDGRYVAFESVAALAAGDTNSRSDVFLRDRITNVTTRVSFQTNGSQFTADASSASLSNNGRFVTFEVENTAVYLRDMLTGTTARIDVTPGGSPGNGTSRGANLSGDGRYIFFTSSSSNLVPGDTETAAHALVARNPFLDSPPTTPSAVTVAPPDPTTTDDLTASASGSTDPDSENVDYLFEWRKSTDGGGSWSAWGNPGRTLPGGLTARGEQWQARAQATDELLTSGWRVSARVEIGNTAPTAPGTVAATPGAGGPDTYVIVASASGAGDVDGDTVTYQYQWAGRNAGEAWSAWGHSGGTLAHADLAAADQWKARARAFDGTDSSSWVESPPVSTRADGTLYVDAAVAAPGDGTTPATAFRTISQAITAAIPGTTIIVAQGTYRENLNFDGKTLAVRSTDPSSPSVSAATIIDGGSAGPVVSFVNGESARTLLSGFTITHGEADYGGGILCQGGAAPLITHNRIQGNLSRRDGGGLSCRGASCTVTDNTISGNHADGDGGGMLLGGSGTPTLAGNIIRDNTARNGAGLVCKGGTAAITDNTIRGNTATQGGGLCCLTGAQPTVSANNFSENRADYGGAIYCEGAVPEISANTLTANSADGGAGLYLYNCSPPLTGNTIADNTADDGAGILGQGCGSLIRDSIFVGNAATRYGGGVYLVSSPAARLENCTLDGNSATAKGGGVCLDASPAQLHNSIISNSLSGGGLYLVGGALPTVTYCNLFGNLPSDYIGMTAPTALSLAAGKGNISRDPGYADRARRDYHPKSQTGRWDALTGTWVTDTSCSPCIDAGDPDSPYGREPQPNGHRINLGAYGNTAEASKAAGFIVAHVPATNATECSRSGPLVVTFRWPVDQASAENHLVVSSADGTGVRCSYKWLVPSVRVSLTPGAPLQVNTLYNVTLTPGARRTAGTTANWAENFSFTTGSAPAVIAHSPRGEAVSPRARIIVGFDTIMHRRSAQSAFHLTPDVPGSFSWSGEQLTFTHTTPFAAGTTYRVTVGARARSASGKELGTSFTWAFTTIGAPSSPALAAVAVPTAGGAQIVVTSASAADVTVSVRTLAGHEVALLQSGLLQAGRRCLVWNRESKTGTKVPPGTYLVHVQARIPQGAVTSQLLTVRLQ